MNLPFLRRKEKFVFPLVRVDDRLLHGQVLVGWGSALDVNPMMLVSDRVAKDSSLAQTFLQLIPEEQHGAILALTDAADLWLRGDFKDKHAMLVMETPVDVLRFVHLGVPVKVLTVGGLHFREGREEILPYVYLSEWDRTTLHELRKLGVKIQCQDLPTSKPVPWEE
jgi:mannose/fructose/N-acetylgalactosamine-specific phosphotransferase system component IIB